METRTPDNRRVARDEAAGEVGPVASMTGFARADGTHSTLQWTWEARSVNGRGLDVRVRLPNGFDALEPVVRKLVAARFKRGNIQIGLQLDRTSGTGSLRVNEAALDQILAALTVIRARVPDAEPVRLDGLLAMRGVLESDDGAQEDTEARDAAAVTSFEALLDGLSRARVEEGAAIAATLTEQIDRIAALVGQAEALVADQPDRLRARLKEQIALLLDGSQGLSEERLHQEVALLLTKSDVREELDRLGAHITAARDLLRAGAAIGRRFDFLTQEFNREANTLCSKSHDIALTRLGLDLKVVIDQMREQVQNVE